MAEENEKKILSEEDRFTYVKEDVTDEKALEKGILWRRERTLKKF